MRLTKSYISNSNTNFAINQKRVLVINIKPDNIFNKLEIKHIAKAPNI